MYKVLILILYGLQKLRGRYREEGRDRGWGAIWPKRKCCWGMELEIGTRDPRDHNLQLNHLERTQTPVDSSGLPLHLQATSTLKETFLCLAWRTRKVENLIKKLLIRFDTLF